MGHGSWFSHFFGTFYANVLSFMHVMGWPFQQNVEDPEQVRFAPFESASSEWVWSDQTWTGLLGPRANIAAEEGHGAQALLHVGLVTILLLILAAVVSGKLKDKKAALVPEDRLTPRTFVELFVGATYGMMKDVMGGKAARYFLPLIGTCAFFILFSNAMGLFPGFLPPTSSLSVTFACGVVIFFTTHIYGVKEHGIAYFKHFLGPVIAWYALPLMILFVVVETISHLVRPLSLGIRLMANMFADHAVLSVFVGLVPFLIPVPILLLGSLVVVVQALVFCLLSTVYIAMAIEHAEDH